MPKFFKNFPADFEQYNPEMFLPAKDKTLDSNGKLHSYDDQPSLLIKREGVVRSATWHAHGEIYREDGKPSQILFTEDRYEARNDKFRRHGEDDLPALISCDPEDGTCWLEWYKDGLEHRDNGLPSTIVIDKDGKVSSFYQINGFRHRDGGLPATIAGSIREWYFLNRLHNETGPAYVEPGTRTKWYLYGASMPENIFNSILEFQKEKEAPLYIAFLLNMKMISPESVQSLINADGKWDTKLPAKWVLKYLNVTNGSMMKSLASLRQADWIFDMDNRITTVRHLEEFSNFTDFLKIITYREQNISFAEEQELEVKPNYAF